jgi:hypothetical protein
MKKLLWFFISFLASLVPIVILTTLAKNQLGWAGYSSAGWTIIWIQFGYTIVLLLLSIYFFIVRRGYIGGGLLLSFPIALVTTFYVYFEGM